MFASEKTWFRQSQQHLYLIRSPAQEATSKVTQSQATHSHVVGLDYLGIAAVQRVTGFKTEGGEIAEKPDAQHLANLVQRRPASSCRQDIPGAATRTVLPAKQLAFALPVIDRTSLITVYRYC